MVDVAARLAALGGRSCELALLRSSLAAPPLARLALPRLAPRLLDSPAGAARELHLCLAESADSAAALEAATLLLDAAAPRGSGNRAALLKLLAARRPTGLLEWYWLHTTLGGTAAAADGAGGGGEGAALLARPLPVAGGYFSVLQAALEWAYGAAAADAASAALDAGFVTPAAAGARRGDVEAAAAQARMLRAVRAGDLEALRALEAEQRAAQVEQQRRRAARRQKQRDASAAMAATVNGGGGGGGGAELSPRARRRHCGIDGGAASDDDDGDADGADAAAPRALPFGARGLLLAAAEAGRVEVLEHLLDRLHSARQLQPRDPIHGARLNLLPL